MYGGHGGIEKRPDDGSVEIIGCLWDRKVRKSGNKTATSEMESVGVKDGETCEKTSHEPVTHGKTLYPVCSREGERHPGDFHQNPSSSSWEVKS